MKNLKSFLLSVLTLAYIPCILSVTVNSCSTNDSKPKTDIIGFYKGSISGVDGFMEFRKNGECEIFECEEATFSHEYNMVQAKRDSLLNMSTYSDVKPSDIDNLIQEAERNLKQIEESGKHMTESEIVSRSIVKYEVKGDTIYLTDTDKDFTIPINFIVANDTLYISNPNDNSNMISLQKVEKPKVVK